MLSAGRREKTLLHGGVMHHHHASLQRAQQSRHRLSGGRARAYCIVGQTVDGSRLPHRCSVPLLKHHMPCTGQRNGTPVYGDPPDTQKPIVARRKPSGFHVHRQHGQVHQWCARTGLQNLVELSQRTGGFFERAFPSGQPKHHMLRTGYCVDSALCIPLMIWNASRRCSRSSLPSSFGSM